MEVGVQVYPVINGYLISSHWVSKDEPDYAGLYFVSKEGNIQQKLITGRFDGITISPNGCKAAFEYRHIDFSNKSLKSINLCQ